MRSMIKRIVCSTFVSVFVAAVFCSCSLSDIADVSVQPPADDEYVAGHTHIPAEPIVEGYVDSTCTDEGYFDEVIYCLDCAEELFRITGRVEKKEHSFLDNVCTFCHMRLISAGLQYLPFGEGYAVCGLGECRDTEVVIPAEYCGLGVVAISEGAFRDCAELVSVNIPLSVVIIGAEAFCGCDSLMDIYYDGTQKMWQDIEIIEDNSELHRALIHVNA